MSRLITIACALAALAVPVRAETPVRIVEGRVDFVTRDGSATNTPSGTITFWTHDDGHWSPIEAIVERGRFRADIDVAKRQPSVGRAVLDGREAWCPFGLRRPRGTEEYALTFAEVQPVFVRVVDSERRDIVGATIRGEGDAEWTAVAGVHALSPWSDGNSKVDAPATWIGERAYAVRAPGMAEGRIRIDPRAGGTREIVLEHEAVVGIVLEGEIPRTAVVYELATDDGSSCGSRRPLVFTEGVRSQQVDGLSAAQYVITALPLDRMSDPCDESLAVARFTLAAGERRVLTLRRDGDASNSYGREGRTTTTGRDACNALVRFAPLVEVESKAGELVPVAVSRLRSTVR